MAKKKAAEAVELPVLAVTPNKAPAVTGNFEELEAALEDWKRKILALEITEDNMELVRVIKAAAQQRRTLFTKEKADTNRILFNQPKELYSKKMDRLIAIVCEVEAEADKILDKEEEARRQRVVEVLDIYRDEFQKQYQLEDRFLARVEYYKEYFNKTAIEKERKFSLEEQFKTHKREQEAYLAGVRLITNLCKTDPRLDTQRYINMLLTEDTVVVSEQVTAEIERLREVDAQAALVTSLPPTTGPTPHEDDDEYQAAESEIVGDRDIQILGSPIGLNFQTDFPGRNKTIQLELTYPCDVGPTLTILFERLWKLGIKSKEIKQPAEAF
jgi:hypothetical protein